jgi:hypothetical protein
MKQQRTFKNLIKKKYLGAVPVKLDSFFIVFRCLQKADYCKFHFSKKNFLKENMSRAACK